MKIILSIKEAMQLKNIMETVEEGSVKDLADCVKNNKLIKVNCDVLAGSVSIEVDEDYTEEFLEVYGKYFDVLVTHAKAMFKTILLLQEETEKVVIKHTVKNSASEEEKQEEASEETKEESNNADMC